MKNHSIKFVKYIFYIILLIIMFFLFNNFFESFYKVTSVNLDIQGNDMGRRPTIMEKIWWALIAKPTESLATMEVLLCLARV